MIFDDVMQKKHKEFTIFHNKPHQTKLQFYDDQFYQGSSCELFLH